MTAPPRTGHDWQQAGLVLAAVAALVGVPALLAGKAGVRETLVEPGTRIELAAPGEEPDAITFGAVGGWEQRATGDSSTAVLRSPENTILIVSVVNGVTDFPEAADWRLKVLGVQAFEAEFDGGVVNTRHGFQGPTCRAVERAGVCAIVGKDNLVVTLALGGANARLDDLAPILAALEVRS
ncbi:hypothetical protein HLB23_20645 [Nocardia uniformis]|uniref:Uncharacterized protein n=1 Tax=Nocardia uniformis TaxID=53432 RepID=A0A849C3B1_9NOCA|nr:hypothetical protein [Nocardia uniformis]NNH72238.1 hypothetical protein [Nocardia uniformis]